MRTLYFITVWVYCRNSKHKNKQAMGVLSLGYRNRTAIQEDGMRDWSLKLIGLIMGIKNVSHLFDLPIRGQRWPSSMAALYIKDRGARSSGGFSVVF